MFTKFRPRIRSRHPSHSVLKHQNNNLPYMPFRSRIRLGSTTEINDRHSVVELNSIDAIKNSSNKLLMKQCFHREKVNTSKWVIMQEEDDEVYAKIYNDPELPLEEDVEEDIDFWEAINNYIGFPIISKHIYGSRGTGNKKHNSKEELESWMEGKILSNYIFEKFYNYVREYRLHVTSGGCFYTCRKMLKRDTPQEHRWYRNDDHCVWILEDNESFDKPVNWDSIVEHSVKALNVVGLDFGAVDVKVQSSTDKEGNKRESPEFIIIEINSAPSFGEKTAEKYIEELPKLLTKKFNETR